MDQKENVMRAIFQKAATHFPLVAFKRGPDHSEGNPETSYSFCNVAEDRHLCFDVMPPCSGEQTGYVWCYMVEGANPSPFSWTHWGEVNTMERFEMCWAFLEGAEMPPAVHGLY